MNQLTLEKSKKLNLTEEDILVSLDSAIKSYSKKDFAPVLANISVKEIGEKKTKLKGKSKGKSKKKTKTKGILSLKFLKSKSKLKPKFEEEKKSKNKNVLGLQSIYTIYKKQIMTSALSIIMLGFVVFSSYIAYAYVAASSLDVVSKVSEHVVVPVGETPKVYIIQSEKSEIFQNPLFKGIQVGDNVLSYTNSNKVIIYRAAEDKIVNIVNTTQ